MDIKDIASFTDYFVICNGTSDRMLHSLAEGVSEAIKSQYGLYSRTEGNENDGWLVVDFGNVVVHLFSPEQREYYNLETLWERGKVLVRLQ